MRLEVGGKRWLAERSLSLVQSKKFVWSMKWQLVHGSMSAQMADNDVDHGDQLSSIVAPERSNQRWPKPKWPRTRQTVDYENGELVITLKLFPFVLKLILKYFFNISQ